MKNIKTLLTTIIILLLLLAGAGFYISYLKGKSRDNAIKIENLTKAINSNQGAQDTISAKEDKTLDNLDNAGEKAEKEANSLIKPILKDEKHIIADTTRLYKFSRLTRE